MAELGDHVDVDGADARELTRVAPALFLARSSTALEDGYGIDVRAGVNSNEEEESSLLWHAECVSGVRWQGEPGAQERPRRVMTPRQ